MSLRRFTLNRSQSVRVGVPATRARVQANTMAFICDNNIHFLCKFTFDSNVIDIV